MTKNFDNYKFRCSSLGKLMTEPRSKSETLSKTTTTYLKEIFIKEVYGRTKEISNKYTEKGLFVEEDSLTLVSKSLNTLLIKNKEEFENDFIKGTPDVIVPHIRDMKSCWDLWTFLDKEEVEKDHYWQLQGYMLLLDKTDSFVDYTLINTPEHLVVQEKSRALFKSGLSSESEEWAQVEAEIDKNMHFDDIERRVRTFKVNATVESTIALAVRVFQCREYLNSLLEK